MAEIESGGGVPATVMLKSVYDPDGDGKISQAQIDGALVPSGAILIWSGAISNIPDGWALCDGNNGTPDLTDRFVLHADADDGGTNNVGDTGGEKEHTLTVDEIPAHTHNQKVYSGTGGSDVPDKVTNSTAGVTAAPTASTGGGAAHNNRDKYYALAYIMKL